MLGLRINGDNFVLDPVLPASLNGLEFNYVIDGKRVVIKYHNDGSDKVYINNEEVPYERQKLAYRKGGYVVSKSHLQEHNTIEVHF